MLDVLLATSLVQHRARVWKIAEPAYQSSALMHSCGWPGHLWQNRFNGSFICWGAGYGVVTIRIGFSIQISFSFGTFSARNGTKAKTNPLIVPERLWCR